MNSTTQEFGRMREAGCLNNRLSHRTLFHAGQTEKKKQRPTPACGAVVQHLVVNTLVVGSFFTPENDLFSYPRKGKMTECGVVYHKVLKIGRCKGNGVS